MRCAPAQPEQELLSRRLSPSRLANRRPRAPFLDRRVMKVHETELKTMQKMMLVVPKRK